MPSVLPVLSSRLIAAVTNAFGPSYAGLDPELRPATRPEFGHFQTNLPLRLAGPLKLTPRAIAAQLVERLELGDLCEEPSIAGQGFVNLTLRADVLAAGVNDLLEHGSAFPARDERVVVDYSQPNVAKQMHVGHLRSTVIGDALCAILAFVGYEVVRQNHVGDWGTQFGMLVEQLVDDCDPAVDFDLAGLQTLYQRARRHFDADGNFADRSRARVVALQSGEPVTTEIWQRMVEVSLADFEEVYAKLGSGLTRDAVVGESAYNDALPGVVEDLQAAGLLTESGGAQCAFLPGFTGRDGAPLPVIVRKSDGGFGYSATDLAAIRYRVDNLHARRIVYVVDNRQALHFQQIFALARTAGWLPETTTAEQVGFGTVLGPDGRPFKTRAGDSVRLDALLDEAVARATALLDARGVAIPEPERSEIARAVGIGAVKYADLANDRTNDYVFALDRMVAMSGNTGPYLQYAHARVTKLVGKAGTEPTRVDVLADPVERRLAFLLGGFGDAVEQAAATLQPHRLCGYLYELATTLSSFYETCPVLTSEGATRSSRIALCAATRQVLRDGLGLLGITAPDAM